MNSIINNIVKSIDKTNVDFIYLIGSYSKNTYNKFSDIDIIVALNKGKSYSVNSYFGNIYVSIHYDSKEEVSKNYNDPFKYVRGYDGLNNLVILYDPKELVGGFLNKWKNVDYFKDFRENINYYVNKEIMDLIEDINKSISGYLSNNKSKMLEGLIGYIYGTIDVLSISEKIILENSGMLETYNKFFEGSLIYQKLEDALGVNKVSLKERVISGIYFFQEVLKIIDYRIDNDTKKSLIIVFENIDELTN